MENLNNPEHRIVVSKTGKYTLLTCENLKSIELYTIKEIRDEFKKGNDEGILDWALDLTGINYIDSSGLAGLANQGMYLSKYSKTLIIINPNKSLKNLITMAGMNGIFTVLSDKSKLI